MAELRAGECALSHFLVGKRGKTRFIAQARTWHPWSWGNQTVLLGSAGEEEQKGQECLWSDVCKQTWNNCNCNMWTTQDKECQWICGSWVFVLSMEVAFIQDTLIYDLTDGLSKHMVSNCGPYRIFNILYATIYFPAYINLNMSRAKNTWAGARITFGWRFASMAGTP